MTTLTPTVHERLAQCGTQVYVSGLVAGADVQLRAGPNTQVFTASSGASNVTVNALQAGWEVAARQDAGQGFTPWSPAVIVEAVALPPDSAPILPPEIGACAQCIQLHGLVPGCTVELRQGNNVVGGGTANREGSGCFSLQLRSQREEGGGFLTARMIVCGQNGPQAATPIVAEPPMLPKPFIGDPIFGCQSVVPVSNVHPGAKVRLEADNGDFLGWFCSCWTAVNVYVVRPLAVGEKVRAQCYWDGGDSCQDDGDWSDWREVIEPDERIRPELLEPLIEGDQHIRVENQIVGASLRVFVTDAGVTAEYGPRPAGDTLEIALNEPLQAGNVVQVAQTLCGITELSNEVTVLPLPPQVVAPVVVPPLYECGGAVQVSSLHLGATVRIYQDGIPSGLKWAGMNTSIAVGADPSLAAGKKVTAKQWIGGVESDESDPGVFVQQIEDLQNPEIKLPVTLGTREVLVSRVTPGSRVVIRTIGGVWLGETFAGEPVVHIPVLPVYETIQATAYLCELSEISDRAIPLKSPCAAGSFPDVRAEEVQLGELELGAFIDSDAFTIDIMGQLYRPLQSDGKVADFDKDAALVVIAHGCFDPNTPSYLGYEYLARHLARWGMVVFSVNLNKINDLSCFGNGGTYQYARAEVILETVKRLLNHDKVEPLVNPNRIGLVGHSMSGEAVVIAQHLNLEDSHNLGIAGVVSIAPVSFHDDAVRMREAKYMQLFGSLDHLNSYDGGPGQVYENWAGVRHYDRAWRPKTFFWIYGAEHWSFNTEWSATTLPDDHLPPETHRHIARCLINAFFQDALINQRAYGRYMQGVILPPSLSELEIYTQHSSADGRTVLDNFGDGDLQIGLNDEPLDKNSNSQGQAAADGGTLGTWDDVDLTNFLYSSHRTKGTNLAWSDHADFYRSDTNGQPVGNPQFLSIFWLSLRVAQFYEDAALNPLNEAADLFVELSDGAAEAVVRLGSIGYIPFPDPTAVIFSMLRTVRLPLTAFQAANPALNIGAINRVRLLFKGRATGHILADDIEFSL